MCTRADIYASGPTEESVDGQSVQHLTNRNLTKKEVHMLNYLADCRNPQVCVVLEHVFGEAIAKKGRYTKWQL